MVIHEGGTNLSGGEKEELLSLEYTKRNSNTDTDEPLANLDEENAKSLNRNYYQLKIEL